MNKIEYINSDNKLNNIIDYTAKYTDIEIDFANKILDLHSKTPLMVIKCKINAVVKIIFINGI